MSQADGRGRTSTPSSGPPLGPSTSPPPPPPPPPPAPRLSIPPDADRASRPRSKLQRGRAVSPRTKAALRNQWVPIDPAPPYEMTSSLGSTNGTVGSYQAGDFSSDAADQLRDPYALTLHFVTDPGAGARTRRLIGPLVKWVDPAFKLFNIAERSRPNGLSPARADGDVVPALSVVLFLSSGDDDENEAAAAACRDNRVLEAQAYLAGKAWRHHHRATTPGRLCPCEPNRQDFYRSASAGHGMPLWGVRQVHYGREHLRFLLHTSAAAWPDMVRFYRTLLGREVAYRREDFCYFLVHVRERGADIQLALKRLPKGRACRPLDSAFLQFKVLEIGDLVPVLPNPCTPISPQRWQTTDPDGNVTLLLLGKRSATVTNNNNNDDDDDDDDRSARRNSQPRVKPRRTSIDALQSLLAPRALRPRMASPGLPVVVDDDDEEENLSC